MRTIWPDKQIVGPGGASVNYVAIDTGGAAAQPLPDSTTVVRSLP